MKNREFGQSGIKLSPITFGSMRLDPQRIDSGRTHLKLSENDKLIW